MQLTRKSLNQKHDNKITDHMLQLVIKHLRHNLKIPNSRTSALLSNSIEATWIEALATIKEI
jgi:hypothetical protein